MISLTDRAGFVAAVRGTSMQNVDAAGLGIGDSYSPRIMGVLNVSEESPYEPSVFDEPSGAAAYVDERLIDQGADIVDIGLESANKRFSVLSADEELKRLDTAIETIASVSGDAVFSIETRYHEVAAAALDAGFDMVNDICGFADPEMPRVCEEYDAPVVKMASPPDLERPGAVESPEEIYEALQMNGFTDKTIIDPAFGGWSAEKTLEDDRETFARLEEFRGLGRPLLVSINRKNFLRELAGRSTDDALPVSLAATSMAVERGAHVIRTHDVAETRDAAIIGREFSQYRPSETRLGIEELDDVSQGIERHFEQSDGSPDSSVIRTFELSGLSTVDQSCLSTLAAEHGATFIHGERGVLLGTTEALSALAENGETGAVSEKMDDDHASLEPVLEAIEERVNGGR